MTESPSTVQAACPTCGEVVEAEVIGPFNNVKALPHDVVTKHGSCDLGALYYVLGRAAQSLRRVPAMKIFDEGGV